MTELGQKAARAIAAIVVSIVFIGCGSGSDPAATAPAVGSDAPAVVPPPPPPEEVTGVALPSTVAVVTATNAT